MNEVELIFYLGIMIGALFSILVLLMVRNQFKDFIKLKMLRDNGCIVSLIKKNKNIKVGVGKFDGDDLKFDGRRRQYSTANIGSTNRHPHIIIYEDGNQVDIHQKNVISPIDPESYDKALTSAIMAGGDMLLKELKKMMLMIFIAMAVSIAVLVIVLQPYTGI